MVAPVSLPVCLPVCLPTYQPKGCLFNVTADESESVNLIDDPKYADIVTEMTRRVTEAGATGGAWAWPIGKAAMQALDAEICAQSGETGFFEPVRTQAPPAPAPTPPAPTPVFEPCMNNLTKVCPCSKVRWWVYVFVVLP
jgi:hypothetical protein